MYLDEFQNDSDYHNRAPQAMIASTNTEATWIDMMQDEKPWVGMGVLGLSLHIYYMQVQESATTVPSG